MVWSITVLPALGGDTISPLCPFPMGVKRSMICNARVERLKDLSEYPYPVEHVFAEKEVFFSRSGAVYVYGREDSPVRELPVQDYFHVARTLELFEDDLVHTRAGLDKGRRHDGQGAALFDISCRAEKSLWFMQGRGIDSARKDLARGRHDGVVCAREPRDAIKENYHVFFVFDEPLGFFYNHLGDLYVALRRFVEGRAYDLAANRALHIRDLFGPLVYEEHKEHHFGVVRCDGVGYGLEYYGLTGPRRGYDKPSLPLSDGSEEVHDPHREVAVGFDFEVQPLFGVERGEVVKEYLIP